MFYRRKVILALIELMGGEIEKLRFQKLLFLYSQKKSMPEYDFVPYKFGCYSYSAKADLNTMVKKGILYETEKGYNRTDQAKYFKQLKVKDQEVLKDVVADYGSMSSNTLIKHTYINFPFYAIHSTIAQEVLPDSLYERVEKARPASDKKALFTIGYEGISLEKYFQKLILNDVKVLVDVRRNPLSMKFGFSKKRLKSYCNSLGIEYIHIPEVGIPSDMRQQLSSQEDYDKLFALYKKTTLDETEKSQKDILALLEKYERIALTCFEANHCQCHRSHLANSIEKLPHFESEVRHI